MDKLRITKKNELRENISLIKKFIDTDSKTLIRRETNMKAFDSYNTAQIKKIKEQNIEREAQLIIFQQQYDDIVSGKMDEALLKECEVNDALIKQKSEMTYNKKRQAKKFKEERSIVSKAFYDADRQLQRNIKYCGREVNKSYRYFSRVVESIPSYILKKLKNMPNNKGYIWRGVHLYGDMKAEPNQSRLLFEKHNGIHITHEWDNKKTYKIWHKKDSNRRKLVSCIQLKKKTHEISLLDYVKK